MHTLNFRLSTTGRSTGSKSIKPEQHSQLHLRCHLRMPWFLMVTTAGYKRPSVPFQMSPTWGRPSLCVILHKPEERKNELLMLGKRYVKFTLKTQGVIHKKHVMIWIMYSHFAFVLIWYAVIWCKGSTSSW